MTDTPTTDISKDVNKTIEKSADELLKMGDDVRKAFQDLSEELRQTLQQLTLQLNQSRRRRSSNAQDPWAALGGDLGADLLKPFTGALSELTDGAVSNTVLSGLTQQGLQSVFSTGDIDINRLLNSASSSISRSQTRQLSLSQGQLGTEFYRFLQGALRNM